MEYLILKNETDSKKKIDLCKDKKIWFWKNEVLKKNEIWYDKR